MIDHDDLETNSVADDPPPIGRRWSILYAIVLLNLALLIVIFYIFTKVFE